MLTEEESSQLNFLEMICNWEEVPRYLRQRTMHNVIIVPLAQLVRAHVLYT